jgi:hypothetical protein
MMAESKFTPGPWVAEKATKGCSVYWWICTEDQFVARTSHIGISAQEQQANAELMAEAPRLLEVLRNLLAYAEIPQSWDGIDEAEQAFTEAHEMLEKHCG